MHHLHLVWLGVADTLTRNTRENLKTLFQSSSWENWTPYASFQGSKGKKKYFNAEGKLNPDEKDLQLSSERTAQRCFD